MKKKKKKYRSGKENLCIRFLYRTVPGRFLLKGMTRPSFSRLAAGYLDGPASRWLISYYVKKHRIPMENCEKQRYPSFNAFFTRKKISSSLRVNQEPFVLVSPCDGFLTVFPIRPDSVFYVKQSRYSLAHLLKDPRLAALYEGGSCLIFRLAPHNYHRYCYPDSGLIAGRRTIPGILHCVRPLALETYPVYTQNAREYTVISTEHFGMVIQMEVGALMVGKIHNHSGHTHVTRGMEKGLFAFGGSTIILLLRKDMFMAKQSIANRSAQGRETVVTYGEPIGTKAGKLP